MMALGGRVERLCDARQITLALLCTVTLVCCGSTPSDEDIRREVENQLAAMKATAGLTPAVDVQQGVVRLSGKTATREVRQQAMHRARSVKGVKVVVNDMWSSNTALIEKVKEALARDPLVGGIPIAVDARLDTVYLISDKTNEGHRTRAIQIASAVEGVSRVEDLMK
jgi:osmotically-inducible protein OsmY